MHRALRIAVLLSLTCLTLASCDTNSFQRNPAPIIVTATASSGGQAPQPSRTPGSGPASASPTPGQGAPTPASGEQPTPASGDQPTPASGDQPTPASGLRGSVTVAFDAFPSYFPVLIMDVQDLLEQRGYELKLVPFLLEEQNDFSEEERFTRLQSGEWDVLATTLDGFARRSDPSIGAITTVIDESAGADKLVATQAISTINDLAGKRIAYSEGSVGEYFLYYALSLAGLTPQDVTLVPTSTVADAVAAFTNGQADAVSAWEPDVLEAEQQGGRVLIASDQLRAILDVLVTSRVAINERPEAVQAFHEAWFDALKLMTDSPDVAEQAIISWGHSDWTTIANPGDLTAALEPLAQATLGSNQLAFRSSDVLISRLREAQTIWSRAGQAPPQADLAQLVEGRFVQTAAQNPGLISSQPPVNSSFLLTAQVNLPQLSAEEQQQAQEIVKLPLEKIDFEPDSLRLTQQAQRDLTEQVLPVMRSSRLYLKIDGSSAWPGPTGRFTAEQIRSFAEQRATSVATFLTQQGINPNRLIIGTLEPKFSNSLTEAELAQDRIVRFTLVQPFGR